MSESERTVTTTKPKRNIASIEDIQGLIAENVESALSDFGLEANDRSWGCDFKTLVDLIANAIETHSKKKKVTVMAQTSSRDNATVMAQASFRD